jgi:hypothetical protein
MHIYTGKILFLENVGVTPIYLLILLENSNKWNLSPATEGSSKERERERKERAKKEEKKKKRARIEKQKR